MAHAHERNERSQIQSETDTDGREAVFPHLADRLDAVGDEMREVFLVKAFLLLADAHGDARTALECLEEAATSGHASGRADQSL
jgi:hypothetical protein